MAEDLWEQESGITVGDLLSLLAKYPEDYPVCFGPHGHFRFLRVKDRSGCVQIEFQEIPGDHYELTQDHPYRQSESGGSE